MSQVRLTIDQIVTWLRLAAQGLAAATRSKSVGKRYVLQRLLVDERYDMPRSSIRLSSSRLSMMP